VRGGRQKKAEDDDGTFSLWSQVSAGVFQGSYRPAGSALPPGSYQIARTNEGTIRFIEQEPREEPLLRFPKVEKIVQEVQYFWTRREVYEALNLPYRRGILVYGPPGTGKTCLLRLALDDVAARGGIGLFYNNNFEAGYDILRQIQPDTPLVVVIEDIDSRCQGGYERELLNLLDGIKRGVSNTVFIATTNYINKLPDRIKNRPSRIDKKFEIGLPDPGIRRTYLDHLIDSAPKGLDTFQHKLRDLGDDVVEDTEGFSLAHLKELFTAVAVLGTSYDEAIEVLRNAREITSKAG